MNKQNPLIKKIKQFVKSFFRKRNIEFYGRAKKEGIDIPKTDKNKINLSTNVFLYNADNIPNNKPIIVAILKDDMAKIKVFLNVSLIIDKTGVSFLINESLKYGFLRTIE